MISLRVSGREESFAQPLVTIGRSPSCDVRFDAEQDLQVSAHHAVLSKRNGMLFIKDAGSTNGTFVNGTRLTAERSIQPGDTIRLGERGPTIEVLRSTPLSATQRIEAAVSKRTRSLSLGFAAGMVLLLATIAVVGYILLGGLPTQTTSTEIVGTVSGGIDYSSVNRASGSGVVLIAVQMPDGKNFTGTGFNIDSAGVIITNRHLVRDKSGGAAKRILVIFNNTNQWLPARVAWINDSADVATLRIEDSPLRYPTILGVVPSAGHIEVGSQVALSGFPLGVATPMEGEGTDITARSTLGAGIVSKLLPNLIQIDAYATDGSSGSPVFDREGQVVGIVYGGMRESNGRIVLALPSEVFISQVAGATAPQ